MKKVSEFLKHDPAMLIAALFILSLPAIAGTGGSELSSLWTDITNGLQGFWGKLIAVLFVGFSLVAAKGGNMLMAFAMFILAMGISIIPGIIDARFTLLF